MHDDLRKIFKVSQTEVKIRLLWLSLMKIEWNTENQNSFPQIKMNIFPVNSPQGLTTRFRDKLLGKGKNEKLLGNYPVGTQPFDQCQLNCVSV